MKRLRDVKTSKPFQSISVSCESGNYICLPADQAASAFDPSSFRPSSSGSNNPQRIKGKGAFFSLRNNCLSELIRPLPLLSFKAPIRHFSGCDCHQSEIGRGQGSSMLRTGRPALPSSGQ
ncbi:hypothetical protein FZC84_16720 [Rossellomorea vietnamensis]|uniref:Uncharacterized protein n=1 Tax=Rossellomorea vietnamensis TaxID=218284 RepID=A0A5D4M953_9BACI|nr:hypothetical protein FZC84_16720 [Rossellomorea vietnamensis]